MTAGASGGAPPIRVLLSVAERLQMAEQTVKHHLTHIFKKLGVSSRADLVAALGSCFDLASDLAGSVDGPADLKSNRGRMKGCGR